MKRVRLEDISVDSGTQIRASIDQQVVADYAEAMTTGATFPPIVLFHDGNTHHVGDGFHRLMAAQRNQFRDIDADVRVGTQHDALWFALGANKANGKRLTDADKMHAIKLALQAWPDRSSVQIAEQLGCTNAYVGRIRYQVHTSMNLPNRVTGKDGKSYPAQRPRTGKQDARVETIAEMVKAGNSNEEIIAAIGANRNDLIAQVRRDIGLNGPDKSRAAIAERRERMRSMAAEGYTSRQIAGAIGLTDESCRIALKKEGIDVPADKVTRGHHHHDSNRIVERMVMDAEHLTADESLIVFTDLDRAQLQVWIDSLCASQKALGSFIRRLKEQQKRGEAAA